jgi:putative hemolysin
MDPGPWLAGALALIFVLLGFMALLSSLETAVLNARRSRLAQLPPDRRTRAAEALIEAPHHFQTTAHLAKSLCEAAVYPLAALAGLEAVLLAPRASLPADLWELLNLTWPGVVGGALLAYLAVTLLAESLPKALAMRAPEALLARWVGFINLFTLLFTPVRFVTAFLARSLMLTTGTDPALTSRAAHSEEEIKLLVEGSAEEGVLENEEKEMIHSIFEFTETVARQVMVPRIDIHSVSVETPLAEVVRQALESGHSRLPVFEGTQDTIVGVIHVKDVLPHLLEGRLDAPLRELMREPYFIPEGKKIVELLHEFRRSKSQLAIVIDEFGGTSGLVTVEDVLEEIVGEIEDEYDVEEHPAAEVSPTGEATIVDARMTIDDVNEQLALNLPEGDYDTLGGFLYSLFGRPPQAGERATYDGLEFMVESTEGLRLQKIRVIVLPPPAEEE